MKVFVASYGINDLRILLGVFKYKSIAELQAKEALEKFKKKRKSENSSVIETNFWFKVEETFLN